MMEDGCWQWTCKETVTSPLMACWLVRGPGRPAHDTPLQHQLELLPFFFFFFFLFCISYLLTYIYIYIFFLHLEDIDIPIVPIWIQVWSLSHRNVSFIQFQVQDLVCCCNCTQMSLLYYLLCVFLLCALVQGLLLYPDDRRYTGRPPQFPPEDVFAELGRVHASPAGAHDFKTSLL